MLDALLTLERGEVVSERLLEVREDLAYGIVATKLSRKVWRSDMYESSRLWATDELELEVMQA